MGPEEVDQYSRFHENNQSHQVSFNNLILQQIQQILHWTSPSRHNNFNDSVVITVD